MPRGKHLSDFEKGQILALHHSCNSISDIARELERSRDVIRSFLSAPESYGTKKRAGRPKKLTDAGKRRILREVINGNLGSASIVKALQLPVKARRVRQVLQDAEHLRYKRMQRTPAMKERHEKERESWAVEKVSWSVSKWSQIVWSDEKKFNLDGPDGLAYKWHDLRREPQWFSKRHSGGESVMVWGAFAGSMKAKLMILDGKQDGPKYVRTLEESLLPFSEDLPLTWTFMQDGAPCHRSIVAKEWLENNFIDLLDWPAYSPDLNPIENLWGILARKVYEDQRQFQNKESLTACILDTWDAIEVSTLSALVDSMRRRCVKVIQSRGKKINY